MSYESVYKIIRDIDDMIHESKFEEVDELLASIEIPETSTDDLIAYATATLWHRSNDILKNRRSMFEAIEKELKSRDDWDPTHLSGLE